MHFPSNKSSNLAIQRSNVYCNKHSSPFFGFRLNGLNKPVTRGGTINFPHCSTCLKKIPTPWKMKILNPKTWTSWWFFTNPFEKCARQNGFIFPKFRGENKKYLETTTQWRFFKHDIPFQFKVTFQVQHV